MFFQRYIVPGLVIMAVMVGGGYATGRELVEFFVSKGPATGLVGMTFTAGIIGVIAMISFELARQFSTFDYRSFCKVFLGRFWWLFELAYLATLLIVLSVVTSAAGKMLLEMTGVPEALGAIGFMFLVAFLVLFGNSFIEKIISAWSILFYIAYGAMFVMVLTRFGNELSTALDSSPVHLGQAAWSAVSYTGYNVAVVPILIFVARHFRTRSEALIAGAIAGPLILLPGFALLMALTAFYPSNLNDPIPVTTILQRLDVQWLATFVKLVILGALIKTGVGMLHGLNERIERAMHDKGATMPSWVRPAVALGCMLFAGYAAAAVGIVSLIANGYRYASYVFWLVFLIPVLTYGVYLISRGRSQPAATAPEAAGS